VIRKNQERKKERKKEERAGKKEEWYCTSFKCGE
jgi:hypothetical protein